MLLDLKLPRGEIQTSPELEEIQVASQYGYHRSVWDELPLEERVCLIAAARDQADLMHIASMGHEDRRNLVASIEWVKIKED